jgi:hypothetical protein
VAVAVVVAVAGVVVWQWQQWLGGSGSGNTVAGWQWVKKKMAVTLLSNFNIEFFTFFSPISYHFLSILIHF